MILTYILNKKQKKYLLVLSRKTLEVYFNRHEKFSIIDASNINSRLKKPAACFVTLTIDGKLRGCVGELEARWPLYRAVINNTLSAAFDDDRFLPLSKREMESLDIEISILSARSPFKKFKNNKSLLGQIVPGKHGIIIENGLHKATYLPQVWDELPDKVAFLESLSQKAGLWPGAWMDAATKLSYYTVEHFGEDR